MRKLNEQVPPSRRKTPFHFALVVTYKVSPHLPRPFPQFLTAHNKPVLQGAVSFLVLHDPVVLFSFPASAFVLRFLPQALLFLFLLPSSLSIQRPPIPGCFPNRIKEDSGSLRQSTSSERLCTFATRPPFGMLVASQRQLPRGLAVAQRHLG